MGIWPLLATLATGASALGLACVALIQQRRIRALSTRIFSAARSDPLTGLLNRRSFEEQLELELERANRGGGRVTVIVGDLDGLAAVNERHGHAVGDEVLRLVAAELVKWKRRIDHGGRIGGEELAVLLPDTDEGGAFLVAERLRRATHRRLADAPAAVTVSFGVASCPDHADGGPALLDAACRALAAAKELGGDRSVIYSPEVTRMAASSDGAAGVDLQLATVIALAEALDIRDTGTARHSHRVAEYAELMAAELGLDADRAERVRLAGLLHDVGKIGVCDQVLAKPGPLDDSEWREMRTHPEIAARLLSRPEFDDLRAWILAHHERADGRGYPYGLAGEDIPLEARILAVADAYEAMTADRVYRPALGEKAARGELEGGAGSQFDADVVDALLAALARAGEAPAGDVVRFAR
ncbi:MAG TPA: diguanylate cyclase [Thermoleophilaceae bacterium]|nr:diguanylate cyclase [Thermoleophilaceae bacterium]